MALRILNSIFVFFVAGIVGFFLTLAMFLKQVWVIMKVVAGIAVLPFAWFGFAMAMAITAYRHKNVPGHIDPDLQRVLMKLY